MFGDESDENIEIAKGIITDLDNNKVIFTVHCSIYSFCTALRRGFLKEEKTLELRV